MPQLSLEYLQYALGAGDLVGQFHLDQVGCFVYIAGQGKLVTRRHNGQWIAEEGMGTVL